MTGTTIAQAIPLAISPILTRIYTPEDFGVFALFIAIFSIFASIANGRYEMAIMLPKKDEDAINIFILGLFLTTSLSLFLLLVIILFNSNIVSVLNNEAIGVWLYFIPFTVFITGVFNALNFFNNRRKKYKDIANAIVIKSVVLSVFQLAIGFLKSGAMGLILGHLIAQFFANMRLLKNIVEDKKLLLSINKKKVMILAKKYKNFPKFSLPAILASVLSNHLTNILISSLFTVVTLGFYSLVLKVLDMPSSLIAKSIGQVFFQEATIQKNETGIANIIFVSTMKKLFLIGFPIFLILFLVSEELFVIVFGEDWKVAGEYAKIVMPLFFIRFVVTTLSATYDIFAHLKVEFIWQLVLLLGTLFIVYISYITNIEFKVFLIYLTAYTSIMQVLSLYIMYKISLGEDKYSDK